MATTSHYPYDNDSASLRHKTVTIQLPCKDLLWDLDAHTHLMGEALRASASARAADIFASDSAEAFGKRFLCRQIESNGAHLSDILSDKIGKCEFKTTSPDVSADSQLELMATGVTSLEFELTISQEFKDDMAKPAAKLMHEYIVKSSLKDWYEALGSNNGEIYNTQIAELVTRIVKAFTARSIPALTPED